jgi:phosphatidylglycerophosphate synthase
MIALGALVAAGFAGDWFPRVPVLDIGIISLWVAAGLTLITGYDYLRVGVKHMDS